MLLMQFTDDQNQRCVGVLEDSTLRIIDGYETTYALAQAAINQRTGLKDLVASVVGSRVAVYEDIAAERRILPPLDHADAAHCFVTGTGLTHLGSADTRDAMHKQSAADLAASAEVTLTDSMKMFRLGVEGGKPANDEIGVQPEWFYKGDGSIVCAAERPLCMPAFSLDGGEEPEIAGQYVIGDDGQPYRVGYAVGNEFSDHVTERRNYLYLAHSKLRNCAVGPALLVGELPAHVAGTSRIYAADRQVRWEKPFVSGERNMSHSIANLEHHHFKYPLFCRPGDVHIHFFGTATLSFSDGIKTREGDTFEIDVPLFGPPLRNRLTISAQPQRRVIFL